MSLNSMNVLCVIDTLRMGGGAEQLLVDLLPEMMRRGVDVEVVALFHRHDDLSTELQSAGVTVHQLNLGGPFSLIDGIRKLRALVRARNFDLFWGHLYYGNFYASLAKRLAGHGVVAVTIHSAGYSQARPTRFRERIFIGIERLILSSADLRVAVSQAVRQDYAAYFGLGDIQVIYNGTDCRRLKGLLSASSETVRSDLGFSDDDFLIVTPASFVPKKGHGVWLDAVQRLRDSHGFQPKVVLCGEGPLFQALAADASRRGLANQVTFSPVIPHERLLPLIAAADAVVLPSLREPFGIAAAEAMALGVACVLSDVDGFRELTAGADCALLTPPGDADALAAAVLRLHSDPALVANLGRRAREHVCARFGIAACAERWIDLLEAQVAIGGGNA
jgi:glycosyltransferase involved in cell wall biosynthesis